MVHLNTWPSLLHPRRTEANSPCGQAGSIRSLTTPKLNFVTRSTKARVHSAQTVSSLLPTSHASHDSRRCSWWGGAGESGRTSRKTVGQLLARGLATFGRAEERAGVGGCGLGHHSLGPTHDGEGARLQPAPGGEGHRARGGSSGRLQQCRGSNWTWARDWRKGILAMLTVLSGAVIRTKMLEKIPKCVFLRNENCVSLSALYIEKVENLAVNGFAPEKSFSALVANHFMRLFMGRLCPLPNKRQVLQFPAKETGLGYALGFLICHTMPWA